MKPSVLSLFLCLGLSLQAGADESLTVTTDRPAVVSYRIQGNFLPCPEASPGIRHDLTLPFGKKTIRAVAAGWLFDWVDTKEISASDKVVELQLQPSPRWGSWLALGLITVLGLGLAWRRRYIRLAEESFEACESLIRTDGQLPQRTLQGYRLSKLLGSGAMGVVYLGQDKQGAKCAIKVPLPHLIQDPDFSQRFQRELETSAKLKHPRIVGILGLPTGSELYLLMEYVEGTTLDRVPVLPLKLELERCRLWCDQILDALQFIHEMGIIHRDLKPANLMVQPDGNVKLMDFGIAHNADRTRLTASGTVLGTPIYMAPEQIQGAPCSPSVDLYALGMILYERLAGKLPFPEDYMALLRVKLGGALPSIVSREPRLPQEWVDFVDCLGAPSAQGRPTSAQDARGRLRLIAPF